MKQFLTQKDQAWSEHSKRFDCIHEETALRKRTVKGGAVQYIHQCLRCGESKGQALAKIKAIDINGGVEPTIFDASLREVWIARRKSDADSIKERFNRESFFENYDDYLSSPAWEHKRRLVLKRAKGSCEGCGDAEPTEVHHLTYAHITQEFLFELVALCHSCHERLHDHGSSE